jgi:hypothetical protein
VSSGRCGCRCVTRCWGWCRRRRGHRYRPTKPINLIRRRGIDVASGTPAAPTRAHPEAAAWVSPNCSVVRRGRAVPPTPFALCAKIHVGLNLEPIRACGEHRRRGQIYRKGAATLREGSIGSAIDPCAGKTSAVAIEEDVETIGRSRAAEVRSLSVDRLHMPRLASWHDKVVSEIGVVRGRVGKCCRHCVIGARVVVLIVKDYLGRCGRAVSPACVQRAAVTDSAPDNHFAAGPHSS